jgi:UDP-2,3-diacylglucosamine pyrophosphatase LpxH
MIVVGDLHLTRHTRPEVVSDLIRLFETHAGERVVIAGDFFDLVADAPKEERKQTIANVFGHHPKAREAVGTFLDRGGELTLLGGNHDADLGQADLVPTLIDLIDPSPEGRTRLSSRPWFLREGGLHLEHGHFYDPDNTPAHPLVVGEPSLGVHFSAEFVAPTGAHRYLNANNGTPLKLFLSSFSWYGKRAPYVIYRYFHAAFAALAKAGPFYRAKHERALGLERQARYAEEAGVPLEMVELLFAGGAPSTLESFGKTFARLYMDRVAATLTVGSGLALAASGRRVAGASTATLGAMLMTMSWLNGHNRYRDTVVTCLERAAEAIAERTGASLVVFGHTHREALTDRYANTGSFAWPGDAPGRPYLRIEHGPHGPRAIRHHLE